jgi:hypothetical protein
MADFSSRSQTLRSNERIKHFVGVLTALGTALLIAAFARISFHGGFELSSLSWSVVAALMLWLSSRALTILEAEDRDD